MMTRTIGLLLAGSLCCHAENWPQWRGEGARGVAPSASAPVKLSPQQNLAWRVKLPGRGCSTPIVWEDHIIITCSIDGKDGVLCVDRKGRERWRRAFGAEVLPKHRRAGSGANPSALTDGRLVFVYYKSGTLAAMSLEGDLAWKRNLQRDYVPDGLKWDLGTSPIFAGGHLVVAIMHNNQPSYLLAFDKGTGKEVWKVSRDLHAPEECNDAYTTPFVAQIDGVETIVCWGGDHLTGHDARDGRELWRHGNFNPKQEPNWRVIASAVGNGEDIAVVPFGRGEFLAGVKMGGKGDTTSTHRLWTREGVGSDSCSPAVRDGKTYVLCDQRRQRGVVTCLEVESGKVLWDHQLERSVKSFYASPTLVGDKLYCAREDGTVFCGTLRPNGLTEVAASKLEDVFIASPVVVDGRLLLRGHEFLWCFE